MVLVVTGNSLTIGKRNFPSRVNYWCQTSHISVISRSSFCSSGLTTVYISFFCLGCLVGKQKKGKRVMASPACCKSMCAMTSIFWFKNKIFNFWNLTKLSITFWSCKKIKNQWPVNYRGLFVTIFLLSWNGAIIVRN